ncbi:MAG: serine hydrolase [Opitutaceae bacterium]|nr:serine hydrolase [Opitutaceae bacterium]
MQRVGRPGAILLDRSHLDALWGECLGLEMKRIIGLWVLWCAGLAVSARAGDLQPLVDRAVQSTLERFQAQGLKSDQLAITLVDLSAAERPQQASYRGEVSIYPASVIKLFYLAAAHRWLEDGKLTDTSELRRAMRDMIVDSSNDATHYVIDLLSGTTSGPELPEAELKTWFEKRAVVTRYFAGLGYRGVNASKKPWGDGPYGRESQAIRAYEPKRNMLTTEATARLWVDIATGLSVTPTRSSEMRALLERDPAAKTEDLDDQAKFTGTELPAGAKLWSKAGWTSQTRHESAYVELPGGRKYVLVVFTMDHAGERAILRNIAAVVAAGMSKVRE